MMMYRFCDIENKNFFCIQFKSPDKSFICTKRFFKEFAINTIIPKNGYLLYRRRNNDQFIKCIYNNKIVRFDNRFIMSFNVYINCKYQVYINTKICITIQIVKYLYKYVYKNNNRTIIKIIDYN